MNTHESKPAQRARAAEFRNLNLAGNLVLPNVWDVASARIFELAGFPAIGTTSGGISYARGVRDAQNLSRDAMIREIAAIVSAVRIPVTADIEAGYGESPADVAQTVAAALEAGAVGINLEDNLHGKGGTPLFSMEAQAERVAAARAAADRADIPLVINARTDTFIRNVGANLDERIAETIARGNAYFAAGADVVFVPVLIDLAVVRRLADALHGPLNLMVTPGAPRAADLFAAGAKRVSIGTAAMLASFGLVREIAAEIRAGGTWETIERHFYGFGEADALFNA